MRGHEEGAAHHQTSTTESKGRETVTMIEKENGKGFFHSGDVSQSAQMKSLVDEGVKRFGGIDIVVNSAGVRTNGSITEITEEQGPNPRRISRAFLCFTPREPEMIKRGGGVIINRALGHGWPGGARGLLRFEGANGLTVTE